MVTIKPALVLKLQHNPSHFFKGVSNVCMMDLVSRSLMKHREALKGLRSLSVSYLLPKLIDHHVVESSSGLFRMPQLTEASSFGNRGVLVRKRGQKMM